MGRVSHTAKAKLGHLSPSEAIRAISKVNDVPCHKLQLEQDVTSNLTPKMP